MNVETSGQDQEPQHLSADQEAGLRGLIPEFEPKGDEGKPKDKKPDLDAVAMISVMYAGAFGILSSRLGAHWALNEQEVKMLAEPTVALIEKYYPDAKIGPEAALITAAFVVVIPRLMVAQPIEGGVVEDGDKSKHSAPQPE